MNKFFKILAPIVALGLLIGALVGINVQAAEGGTTTPEIISMNVEYGSELYLYYAVDKASVEGKPSLEVLDAEGNVTDTVTYYTEETVNSIPCYVFRTAGVAPGQLNKAEYVRAAAGDVKGETVKYSVEDYLYTRLYKNGFVAKTEADGDDYVRRNLYFQLLAYGKSAQTAFYPGAEDKIGNPGVAIKGNAAASGEYAKGDCIVLSAPAIEGFDYWSVTELTPFGEVIGTRKLGAGYEYLLGNQSAMIIPVTDDDAAEGVEAFDTSVINFNTDAALTGSFKNAYVNTGSTMGRVFDVETGNWYYKFNKVAGSGSGFRIYPTGGDKATATEAVAEFDIYVTGTVSRNWQIHMPANTVMSSAYAYSPFLDSHMDSLEKVVVGQWNHVKITYSVAEDGSDFTVAVYVNDMEKAAKITTSASFKDPNANGVHIYGSKLTAIPAVGEIDRFEMNFNGTCTGEYYIDNASFIYK